MNPFKITFYLFLCCASFVDAKQVSFSKSADKNYYNFNYQWLDHSNQQQSISFALTKSALFEHFRDLKPYQSEFAHKTIMHRLKKQLDEEPLNAAQAFFLQKDGETIVQIKGQEDQQIALAYKKVKAIKQEATKQYLQENYYQLFNTHDGETGIKINHADVANDSLVDFKHLKPIILDKITAKTIRKVTDYVLGFVQSIPYSTLESRVTSSGSGFNSPAKLLWENQGDCDSKVTLTATILRTLMPNVEMVMVYIDKHAFMGIAVPAKAGDTTLIHQGITYLLAEPTGPALYKLGKIAPESELAIDQGRYVAEVFYSDNNNS
ncbi:hypothetical protein Q4530_10035 [Colwellia sp. 1_MG-2023]|uniref:hypothetical protein n=1 Tax=unclassified Colwellia TaxID=196834 RepID=UPI0020912414|nr:MULTISPECIES: hypothetical protein [unclassified Colwellia]MDO6652384.1 hypothetical protein [Colwellia sp. 3_MG-2023]MDO6665741.1 hypothetical protein [Colwellia sp. 2_MG-2023]MDO6690114.1 hypothetical protein [Colwellia sp. 1_MG-2023]